MCGPKKIPVELMHFFPGNTFLQSTFSPVFTLYIEGPKKVNFEKLRS